MKQDNIIAAPQSSDYTALQQAWQQQRFHDDDTGDDLYTFLTSPSYQRDVLLQEFTPAVSIEDGIVITDYKA